MTVPDDHSTLTARFAELIDQHDVDGAAEVAEQAQRAGLLDAERMLGLVYWLRGDRMAARSRWETAVARGDVTALAYLAVAAHGPSVDAAERLAVMARLEQAACGPNGEEVISRIVAASVMAAAFDAEPAWAVGLLFNVLREGRSTALEAYLRVCGVTQEDLATDPKTDEKVLALLAEVRTGMVAWYACGNPSLPEYAASEVIAGTAESLIRALAGNEGLSMEIRSAAQERLHLLEARLGDSEPSHMPGELIEEAMAGPTLMPSDLLSRKISSTKASPLSSGSPVLADLLRALLSGDFEAVLQAGECNDRETSPKLSFAEEMILGQALAWQSEQEPQSEHTAVASAKAAFETVAKPTTSREELLATLHVALLAWRHSLDDLDLWLDKALALLQMEVEGLPLYATDIDLPRMPPETGHPWIVQWYADLHSILDWLMEAFPHRAGAFALERGDLSAAEACFREAMRSDAPYIYGFAVNSLVFSLLIPQEKYDEAEKLLISNAGSPWRDEAVNSQSNLGIVAFHRGEFGRAKRLFEHVRGAAREHTLPEATYYLALIEAERGQPRSAIRLLQEVMRASDSRYVSMAQAAWAMLMLETEGSSADPSDLNSSGCYLREAGRAEAARSAFLLAAAGGDPNALASLTWPMVLADRMHESIADFENYADAVTRNTDEFPADAERRTHLRWARANAWSNAGLAFLATGQQDRALELWKQAAVVGHVEARVYPAVLAWRQGDRSKAFELLANRIESYEVMEFAADMCEVLQEGTGWFLDWASDALDLVVSQPDADSLLVNNVAQARFAATQDDGALIEAVWSPARCGVPPAVASLVLRLRRRGETRASVEAFEECEPAMQAYVEALPSVMPESDSGSFIPKFRGMFDEQVTEARTEAGVSYVLLGRVDEAERLWRDPGARWFPEALLWRAILCLRAGKVDDAGTLIRRLLPAHRDLLERRLDHWIQNCSQEPERRWYQEGRDALLRIPGVGRPWTT